MIPYLPIFLSQIGIQRTELAIIYCLIFFLTFFKNIVIAFIADKYQLHKAILILSCILTGPLYATLLAVPKVVTVDAQHVQLQCFNSSYFLPTSVALNEPNSDILCELSPSTCTHPDSCLTQTVQICNSSCQDDHSSNIPINYPMNESRHSDMNITLYSALISSLQCNVTYNCPPPPPPPYTSTTFWLCLTIGLLAALCGSNELMMNDAIALSILGKSFGFSLFSK